MSVLRQRVLSGTLLGAATIVLLLLDAWLATRSGLGGASPEGTLAAWLSNGAILTLLVLILSALTAREITGFVRMAGHQPNHVVVQVFAAGLVIGPYLSFNLRQQNGWSDESWGLLWVALALGAAFLVQAVRRRTENATQDIASTVFIVVYTGGLAGYMTRLRMEVGTEAGGSEAVATLLFSILLVKVNDMGAFFTGRTFGKHKLIPWLSPKKTWEGFVGGILATIACSLGLGSWLHYADLLPLADGPLAYPWGLVWFGLLMALFSVAGDLAASLLKRDAAVKDSGSVIPGMGGVLDVLDSPLLAAPAAWFFWTRLV